MICLFFFSCEWPWGKLWPGGSHLKWDVTFRMVQIAWWPATIPTVASPSAQIHNNHKIIAHLQQTVWWEMFVIRSSMQIGVVYWNYTQDFPDCSEPISFFDENRIVLKKKKWMLEMLHCKISEVTLKVQISLCADFVDPMVKFRPEKWLCLPWAKATGS